MFQLRVSKGISEQQLVAPVRKASDVFGPKPRMISNHFARAAAAKKIVWTPEALLKILEEMSI